MLLRRVCGIDLGSDTIKICDKNEKLFLLERNMIAIRDKEKIIATGNAAFEMFEKTPANVTVESPMDNGGIANTKNLEIVLNSLLKKFSSFFGKYPKLFITAPTEISEVERRAFHQMLCRMKTKKVTLVEKGVADAIGIGMPVDVTEGNMIVNIGAFNTDISVISEGKIIVGRVMKIGGKKMDEDIATMVFRQFHLNIGSKTAEYLKNHLAYAQKIPKKEIRVFGIHTVAKVPKDAVIPALSVSVAIVETLEAITEGIKSALERTPPQLLENIRKNGVYLTGGVSAIPDLAEYARKELDIPVYSVVDPALSTIRGLVRIIGDSELQKLTHTLKEFAENTI